jgi:hypothetical protein
MSQLTRLALQQMLRFISSDMGYSSEDIRTVSSTTLDTVTMIDTTLSCFFIHIEMGEVVVEIHRTSTEVTTQQSSMGGENGAYIELTLLDERKSNTSLPLVEMGNHSRISGLLILHFIIIR